MSSSVCEEVTKFCEATTVRGIPRIFKAKTPITFTVWLIAILACSGLLICQLTTIFIRYAQYPVNTQVIESPESQSAFPDLTICNANPLVYDKTFNITYSQYVNIIYSEYLASQLTAKDANISTATFQNLLFLLAMPKSYFSNLPIPAFNSKRTQTIRWY